jgi:hypothetical protein
MCWSILLVALCEVAEEDAAQTKRRAERAAEKKRDADEDDVNPPSLGGVLAVPIDAMLSDGDTAALIQKCFDKLWMASASWATPVMQDALEFAKSCQPRSEEVLSQALQNAAGPKSPMKHDEITTKFVQTIWPSLKSRGWKAQVLMEGPSAGSTQYSYNETKVGL